MGKYWERCRGYGKNWKNERKSDTKIQLSDITGHAEQKVQEFGEQLKENKRKSCQVCEILSGTV